MKKTDRNTMHLINRVQRAVDKPRTATRGELLYEIGQCHATAKNLKAWAAESTCEFERSSLRAEIQGVERRIESLKRALNK
jgi:hypothetical protein